MQCHTTEAPGGRSDFKRTVVRLLWAVVAAAIVLLVHNYGLNLLPSHHRILAPAHIVPDPVRPSFAYHYHFPEGVPDRPREMRSRVVLREDGRPHSLRTAGLEEIITVGGDRYAHQPGLLIFATVDNSDPRTNGRLYTISWPWLYSDAIGRASAVLLLLALASLWCLRVRAPNPAVAEWSAPSRYWWWLALVVFVAGLYCSTGTRSPYGITFAPAHVDPATGFIYNQDHVHFKVLYEFVDGAPRSVWDRALLLRRILYPVLGWPAMKVMGFEAGGVTFNLALNVAAFVAATWWLRRRHGARAAAMGAWLLATYPGFAYWVGMPYQYALIAPGALLLAMAVTEIAGSRSRWRTGGWALAMGVMYLAYDFAPIFLPATLGLLLWRRRWLDTVIATLAGVLPLLGWLMLLRYGFGQALENSNTGVYRAVLAGIAALDGWEAWLAGLLRLWDTGVAVFFGSNFIFLPAVFLAVLCVNPWTSRVRLADSEWAILGATALLFAVINLGPDQGGTWVMGGSWISRLYQPLFPVLVFFVARWWQAMPALPRVGRTALLAGLIAAAAGNVLVVFGPVAGNPLQISGDAFYRFYTHSSSARVPAYENSLRHTPTRLLGFGRSPAEEGR